MEGCLEFSFCLLIFVMKILSPARDYLLGPHVAKLVAQVIKLWMQGIQIGIFINLEEVH
ncbi:hypothetical protein D3C77_583990 [compost metagenome]